MTMETKSEEIKHCKPGTFVLIDDEPCIVTSLSVSKPGKHGEAKARIEAVGIFDNVKRSLVKPGDYRIQVPIIDKRIAQVLVISGDYAQVMDSESYETFEAKIPEELKDKITEGREVLVWRSGKKALIKALR